MKRTPFSTAGIVGGVLVLLSAMLAWALEQAPLNPEFRQHQAQQQVKALTVRTADGHGLGHIPAPFKLPQPAASLAAQRNKLVSLPASYDLRNYSKVSPVRDQGAYGNCWAFATFGSMESCLLTGETWDFSENNLANKHGLDSAYGDGGNQYMSLAYLGRWGGPVLESADPYSNGSSSPGGLTVQKHIQSAQFIPDRTSIGSTDNDKIKQAIMTYGAIYSAYYHDNSYYNAANCAYYYNGSSYANHAITVMGWNDAFSRTNFNITPAGDGAFLIKNSWGDAWGNAGYFWISYYDELIGTDNCLFLNAESTANYASVYQYDPLGFCTSFGYESTTAWGANIFFDASGTIEAVSFYAPAAGASYEVRVYTGATAGSPTSGTLSATKTGTLTYAGYYTVTLDTPVTYATRFSVVVKLTTPEYDYPIAAEYPFADYSSTATASSGESYLSSDGSTWEEAYDAGDGVYFNVCIKAFGTGGEEPTPTPTSTTTGPIIKANGTTNTITVNYPETVSITVAMNAGDYLGDNVDWWLVASAHSGEWYYLNSAMQWMSFNGNVAFCRPVYQGPLFNLAATPVLNEIPLLRGTYDIWFAVDYPMDGILDQNGLIFCDKVTVIVQ